MKIWKCPSGIFLFHRQSWWYASFQYSFKCNHMPTSVDNHVSKDDDIKMSFRYIFALNCCQGLLDHGLSLNNIAPSWSERARSSVYNQEVFFITRC
jgi:hypothetical protein